MKKQIKSNGGFSLVELIIAIAVLAFLMTAVGAFMSSGVLSFKKAKADIIVHNSAQDTYNQLMDSIMQANDIVIYAYTVDTTPHPDGSPVVMDIDFSTSGADLEAELSGLTYYVRDNAQWLEFKETDECRDPLATPKYFSDIPDGTVLYIKEIITDVSVPVDLTYANPEPDGTYENKITGEKVNINVQHHKQQKIDPLTGLPMVDLNGNPVYESTDEVKDVLDNVVYDTYDTQRNIFTFDEENMYYQTRYAFMTGINDVYPASVDDDMYNYIYSESFSYVLGLGDVNVSGCMMIVDATEGAVDIDLKFNDKNMTYSTQGMVKFRNSYVLRAKN